VPVDGVVVVVEVVDVLVPGSLKPTDSICARSTAIVLDMAM
jgi:hypothetical protein